MKNPYYQGPVSDHFDGNRFFNPRQPSSDKTLFDLLRWRLAARASAWPDTVAWKDGGRPPDRSSKVRITAIGRASVLVQAANLNLLLDPVWSLRASPVSWIGPRRHCPPAVAFEELPPIDVILISHNHYDHLDSATIRRLYEHDRPLILAPLGNDRVIKTSVPEARLKTGDWWQAFELSPEVRATIVPSYHWSSRSIRDRRMALWGGFMLDTPAGRVYCAGDTAYGDGVIFSEIRRRCGEPSVALLPIGAYAPRWFMQSQHVNPSEALMIASDCGAKEVLGIHWGTFRLTDEPYAEPPELLSEAAVSQSFRADRARAMIPGDFWEAR